MKNPNYISVLTKIILTLCFPLLLIGCSTSEQFSEKNIPSTGDAPKTISVNKSQTSDLEVHFLDVGQGLSIFARSDGQTLIYDGGDRSTSSFVVSYLKKQGVKEIDYLISSHYDADHLAGLIGCLNAFDIHHVISSDYEHDTKLYTSFIDAVQDNDLTMQHPQTGTEFAFGSGRITVLAPDEIVNDSNANSVVIKLTNGDHSFIFTGDADHKSEAVMCSSDLDLSCDVLSISHHGSATATSYEFLQETLPETAVISAGKNNSYGHPHRDVMDKLESMEIDIYRSDIQGTVIAVSNGTELTWNTEPCNDYSPGDDNDYGTQPIKDDPEEDSIIEDREETQVSSALERDTEADRNMVYKSGTGKKYHSKRNCGNMNPDKLDQISIEQAKSIGLEACRKCF